MFMVQIYPIVVTMEHKKSFHSKFDFFLTCSFSIQQIRLFFTYIGCEISWHLKPIFIFHTLMWIKYLERPGSADLEFLLFINAKKVRWEFQFVDFGFTSQENTLRREIFSLMLYFLEKLFHYLRAWNYFDT